MRGHAELIAMRRRGIRPMTVFIDTDCTDPFWSRQWPVECPDIAHIDILPPELVSGLDLRCVTGMPVLVQGSSRDRVQSIARECLDCGARNVVLSYGEPGNQTVEDWEAEHA